MSAAASTCPSPASRPDDCGWREVAALAGRALAGSSLKTVRLDAAALARELLGADAAAAVLAGTATAPVFLSGPDARLYEAIASLVEGAARRAQNAARAQMLFDRAPVCIQSIDLAARITSTNATGREMFPVTASRVPGLSFLELVADADRASVAASLSQALEGAESEFSFSGVDGKFFDARFIPVRDGEGEVASLIGVTKDVTARREAEDALREREAELRQAQKMEAIGRLAGGIAHDFNNLLTAISGYADFAIAGHETATVRRRDLEEIRLAAGRAASLTRQLLAFSRRQVLQPTVFDLTEVAIGMHGMLRRLIGEDIEIATRAAPGGAPVRADVHQIEQVLLNLALNARDAMPTGGKLTIEVGNAGADVVLTVTDTGVGMSSETLAHVFEPFFTTKEQGKGTGLGLATVYGIVEQSGGSVRVGSEPGRGTRFEVRLPRASTSPLGGLPTERGVSSGSETVLLAEDEAVVRELVRRTLDARGYRVLEATGGVDALRVCREYPDEIHLILTDVVMPELGGVELVAQASELRPEVRSLYMSGYTDEVFVQQGVLGGDVAFIGKPFTPETLARKVREVLDAAA